MANQCRNRRAINKYAIVREWPVYSSGVPSNRVRTATPVVHLPGRTAVFEKDSAGMGAVDRTAFAGVKEYLSHAVRKGYRDKVFDVGGGNFWKPLRFRGYPTRNCVAVLPDLSRKMEAIKKIDPGQVSLRLTPSWTNLTALI